MLQSVCSEVEGYKRTHLRSSVGAEEASGDSYPLCPYMLLVIDVGPHGGSIYLSLSGNCAGMIDCLASQRFPTTRSSFH